MATDYVTRGKMGLEEAHALLREAGHTVEPGFEGSETRVSSGGSNYFWIDASGDRVCGTVYSQLNGNDPSDYSDLLDMVSEHEDGYFEIINMGEDDEEA